MSLTPLIAPQISTNEKIFSLQFPIVTVLVMNYFIVKIIVSNVVKLTHENIPM